MDGHFTEFLDRLSWWLTPGRCLLCGLSSGRRQDLCGVCAADLEAPPDPCTRCGLPRPGAGSDPLCPDCRRRPPRHLTFEAACRYDDPADLLVQALKFRGLRAAARVMADVMWTRLAPARWPAGTPLLPVPLHPWRQWRRGYNQSALLAKELARLGGWPVLEHAVRRLRPTRPQSGLDRRARRRNLAGAFHVARPGLPAELIVVDDVVTTGATLDALAGTLQRAGVRRIHAWAFARTPPRGSH